MARSDAAADRWLANQSPDLPFSVLAELAPRVRRTLRQEAKYGSTWQGTIMVHEDAEASACRSNRAMTTRSH